jgi:preprotein translocase subunit SecA
MWLKKNKINSKYYKELKLVKQNKTNMYDPVLLEIIDVIEKTHQITLFDNQILAAFLLIDGFVLDMGTGEGKTYSGLLAACYLAKQERTVHIVTANDYLAYRDFTNNKIIFETLDITASALLDNVDLDTKRVIYNTSIIYSTPRRLALDYLFVNRSVQQYENFDMELDMAIIDEADSVLLDQSNHPVITSDVNAVDTNIYLFFQENYSIFEKDVDFTADMETKKISLNDTAYLKLEQLFVNNNVIKTNLSLYNSQFIHYINYLKNTLMSNYTFQKDVDYVIDDNKVILIDQDSGRKLSQYQRFSMGLHQALEAKENVDIKPEEKITGTITLQNFFRKYNNLSAMSGTAKYDKDEFKEIFDLDLQIIPSSFEDNTIIYEDKFFIESHDRDNMVIDLIKKIHSTGQPILIASTTVQESEKLSQLLTDNDLEYQLLNAKNPQFESEIISKAGLLNQITVSTNIAGRGTDVKLGGDEQINFNIINDLGGLFIIGYGRSDNRRIDQQLIGRCGRKGNNGRVQFFLSLGDPIAQSLPKKQIADLFGLLKIDGKEGAFHSTISSNFLRIQKKMEQHSISQRKEMIKFDDIIEKQRFIYFDFRKEIVEKDDIKEWSFSLIDKWTDKYLNDFKEKNPTLSDEQTIVSIENNLLKLFQIKLPFSENKVPLKDIPEHLNKALKGKFDFLESNFEGNYEGYLKANLLHNLNSIWSDYIQSLENLKKQVKLRNLAQKNPFDEFSDESFQLFNTFVKELPFQIMFILLQNHYQMNKPKETTENKTNA